MDLKTEEARLLALLLPLENEASRLLLSYEETKQRLDALRLELDGVRSDMLEKFLAENLTTRLLGYTIKTDAKGETVLAIIPLEGGQLEFDRMKSVTRWMDMNNIPLFYVINYLGKGIPYG